MSNERIDELKRIFITRLDALDHILSVGEKHFPDMGRMLQERLVDDMFPLGTQIAFACNQPRGFSQWCAGQPIDNFGRDVTTMEMARSHLRDTKARVAAISVDDTKLDDIKRIGLGPGLYCELPGHRYVSDYLTPNLYFHITTAYAILRHHGAPVGKTDFMMFLAPYVREEEPSA
ncbi:DUF1993 domain-containing protein [Solilutibacter silvestris]|uniref:DUF1993 domain-containing protein n=1 Tax=Solilutibacter silvestris TaxID=1645665 RepID=A0A2K1Q3V8_9GAMM|nr:DUF1993 domain-containing protein [Lysobacter silvestris]PNS09740.1 hypothetical protein Lysil_1369 [Lysobacter silvestris]